MRPRCSFPTSRPCLLPHRRREKRSRHRPPSSAAAASRASLRLRARVPTGVPSAAMHSHGSLLALDGFPSSSVPRPQNCPGKGPHAVPRAVSLRAGQSAAAAGPRSPGAADPDIGNRHRLCPGRPPVTAASPCPAGTLKGGGHHPCRGRDAGKEAGAGPPPSSGTCHRDKVRPFAALGLPVRGAKVTLNGRRGAGGEARGTAANPGLCPGASSAPRSPDKTKAAH